MAEAGVFFCASFQGSALERTELVALPHVLLAVSGSSERSGVALSIRSRASRRLPCLRKFYSRTAIGDAALWFAFLLVHVAKAFVLPVRYGRVLQRSLHLKFLVSSALRSLCDNLRVVIRAHQR